MNIGIIGVGYVGLVTGACLADQGNNVICMDVDASKISLLSGGRIPYYEPGLPQLLERNSAAGNLSFTTDLSLCMKSAEYLFICVGTPEGEDLFTDLRAINTVTDNLCNLLERNVVIVVKSTVPAGTTRKIYNKLQCALRESHKQLEVEVVSNPEFLSEGCAVEDFLIPDRIVIGTENGHLSEKMTRLYQNFINEKIPVMHTIYENAEMIKYASNALLAAKISYMNEIAAICEFYKADVRVVAQGMGYDRRIGNLFLKAGAGYGGSCFPKDTNALLLLGEQAGCAPGIVRETIKTNQNQIKLMLEKIKRNVEPLNGSMIGVLGVSFKPETDDIREAPAVAVIEQLLQEQAGVKVYDPRAMESFRRGSAKFELESEPDHGVICCSNAYDACTNVECIVLFTEWKEFEKLDFGYVRKLVSKPVFLDFRNFLSPEKLRGHGFVYEGIGVR